MKLLIMYKNTTGKHGENIASKYLEELGYKIIERNFRIKGGEIDIIAQDKEYLVFIEVKTRYSHNFGLPIESITPWKVKFLLKTAQFYIQKIGWKDRLYRLDFVGVDFSDDSEKPSIELLTNITS